MSDKQTEVWYFKRQPKGAITLTLDKRMLLTILLSLLLHLAILWLFAPRLFSVGTPQPEAPKTLNITLAPPQQEEVAGEEAAVEDIPETPPTAAPQPTPPIAPVKQKPKPKAKKMTKQVPIKKAAKSAIKVPEKQIKKEQWVEKPPPQPKRQPAPAPLPGEDMQAYMQRRKIAKLQKQGLSKRDAEEYLQNNNPKSGGTSRDATIRKNLNLDGTNGIFQIRYLGLHQAEFSFKGWKNNVNTARLEVIQVQAENHQNIKLAVIRKMIEIIRREYNGDFNWDSQRTRQIIKLSARREDSASLEAFMMDEFFGPGSQYQRYP